MKSKVIVWGYLIVLSLGTMLSLYMPKTEAASKESIVIPGEAIRLRILANSDFEEDQAIKRKVRDAVNAQITLWVQDLTSMEKARTVIKSKLPEIQAISEQVVRDQGSDQSVKVEFGKVQFPTKLYGQFLYPAGEYQAILITLGSGEGANWWCVLYPPLCFLDFSNGVAVSEGFEGEKKAKAKTVIPAKSEEKVEKAKTVATVEKVKEEASSVEDTKEVAVKVEKEVEVKGEKEEKATTVDEEEMKKPERLIEKDAPVFNEIMVEVDDEPVKLAKKDAPVYTADDEKPVEVKFFVVEMWEKMFN
ncbi:stage II sporulation protein R [Bacillus sp. ISL-40]|uniref:stage II sporulation protein R n=1 Tax=unclassified Bacillus (in: firmicutes) TaxID=185979 RepID=UPI001BE746ED|nr:MULTISPECIES: stage II sporulation protein R [unclassified Bacillus (in: firmicutes)]MBT2699034.1 stage II sporulation protein R [Bacillus sp. ISL-40]MBT2723706.1 stage II sporulation protein R [Bacillus sp. ISL-46]MBT2739463.1 stage II sporulation protein R [Bacillus sp. ISL-77]